jgi:phenol 2-monooxygenase
VGVSPNHSYLRCILSLIDIPNRAFQAFSGFTSGTGVHYSPSAIVEARNQKYAPGLVIGQRMPPQIFIRAADMRPIEIQDMLPADIRFKLLLFVGHLTETRIARLNLLAEDLSKPTAFLQKYSAHGNNSSIFDIVTVTAGKKDDINYLNVPALFRPHWSKWVSTFLMCYTTETWTCCRVLLDDIDVTGTKGGNAYDRFGIDTKEVIIVVIRPDGYVGMVAPSTALEDLDGYFGSFLLPQC